MKEKHAWLARDRDGWYGLHKKEPAFDCGAGEWNSNTDMEPLDGDTAKFIGFPKLPLSGGPIKVTMKITRVKK